MDEFPSNSYKQREVKTTPKKEEPKKVEKIIEGKVIQRKTPISKKLFTAFIGGDAKSTKEYVIFDVVVPTIRNLLVDSIESAARQFFTGSSHGVGRGNRSYSPPSGPYGHVAYNRYSPNQSARQQEQQRPAQLSRRGRAQHDFDEIVLATRVEAEEVVDRLFDLVSRYDMATVSDLYNMLGLEADYTDDKWGWINLEGAGVTHIREGYLLKLPRPEPLK